jgi:hypothetical protein
VAIFDEEVIVLRRCFAGFTTGHWEIVFEVRLVMCGAELIAREAPAWPISDEDLVLI